MDHNYIQKALINWYQINKRDLPWRGLTDPYKIWLSEIILQQTRVNQGLNYYLKFVESFPDVIALANAKEDEVLKLWQGLGYYSRARNLLSAAKQVAELDHFPRTYHQLLQLKGVGAYTAAAIASFAYEEPVAVVDGNVFRVLSRLFGISTAIDTTSGQKEFTAVANSLLARSQPSIWNQAIMEFGALQCVPKSPDCSKCPISSECVAFNKNSIEVLPFKQGKVKQQLRYIYYYYMKHNGNTIIKKRPSNGIWGGLFEFPSIESKLKLSNEQALNNLKEEFSLTTDAFTVLSFKEPMKHILSHRIIQCSFVEIELKSSFNSNNSTIVPIKELANYPVSRLMEKYISKL